MITLSNFSRSSYRSTAISIARWNPSFYKGENYPDLYPSSDMLLRVKSGSISFDQYEDLYREEILSNLDPEKVYKDLDGKILLCHCGMDKQCHRNIVASWLRENNFEVKNAD